jgi:hypothetical protein
MKKTLITLGTINILHAGLHLFQFVQSLLLVNQSIGKPHGFIHILTHSPYFAIVWAILGIFTLWVGIKDYKHHNKCKDDNIHTS